MTAKLSKDKVLSIRERVKNGEKQIDLAREFGITRANISLIIKKKIWRDL